MNVRDLRDSVRGDYVGLELNGDTRPTGSCFVQTNQIWKVCHGAIRTPRHESPTPQCSGLPPCRCDTITLTKVPFPVPVPTHAKLLLPPGSTIVACRRHGGSTAKNIRVSLSAFCCAQSATCAGVHAPTEISASRRAPPVQVFMRERTGDHCMPRA